MINKKIITLAIAALISVTTSNPISMFERITEIGNEEELQQLIANPNPLVVVFYAVWCGVCNQIKNPMEQTANKQQFSHVRFVCIDVDKFRDLADKYNIKGVPSFLFFKNRVLMHHDVGVEHMDKFQSTFESNINKVFSSNSVSLHNLIDYDTVVKTTESTTPAKQHGLVVGALLSVVQFIKSVVWYLVDKIADLFVLLSNLLHKLF